jgi:hypothetical protein
MCTSTVQHGLTATQLMTATGWQWRWLLQSCYQLHALEAVGSLVRACNM